MEERKITVRDFGNTLTLWGLRVFWGPGEVLTCPDLCAFSVAYKHING